MTTAPYSLHFPPEYDSEEWIWTSKGYIVVRVEVEGELSARYSLTVRDPTRLAQDVEAELAEASVFSEPNVVVVRSVDRESIEDAVRWFAERDFHGLVPE